MTLPGLGHRWAKHPAVLLLAATLPPALVCTLLVWRLWPHWWQLSTYFWYSIPGNSFLLFPHEPAVVYAGKLYAPALVAVVGGAATLVASIVDYVVVRRVFRLRRVAPVKEGRAFQLAVRLFRWQPWLTIVAFAFSPVPFYPIRVLAPAADYPMVGYVSAVVLGRIPRYFLIALGGAWGERLIRPYLLW